MEIASITPTLAGRVWLKSIRHPFLNRPVHILNWSEVTRRSRAGVFDIMGRSAPTAVDDVRGSQQFTLQVVTDDLYDPAADGLTQKRDLDLALASGDTFFLHVPANQPIPGGYLTIGDTSEDRIVRAGTQPFVLTLPCTVVTAPGPDVVGSTLTWTTVLRLYDSWPALIASNPTWLSLLQTVGSPEDLVVL